MVLCDNLEGWDGGEVQEGGDICILVADHVVVCQKSAQYCNYPPITKKKNFQVQATKEKNCTSPKLKKLLFFYQRTLSQK